VPRSDFEELSLRMGQKRLMGCRRLPPAVLQRLLVDFAPSPSISSATLSPVEQMEWWMHKVGTFFQAVDMVIEKMENSPVLPLLDLGGAPLQNVLSFLEFLDRLKKAEACKLLHQGVEALCSTEIEHFKKQAYNDDAGRLDFGARIQDQQNIDTSATMGLPKRLLRWSAVRKYIRHIDVGSRGSSIRSMAISPSGNRIVLLFNDDRHKVEIWDHKTNTKLATIQAAAIGAIGAATVGAGIVFLAENRIVFSTISVNGTASDGYECWTEESGLWNRTSRLTVDVTDQRFKFFPRTIWEGPTLFPKSKDEIFVAVWEETLFPLNMTVKVFSVDITTNSFVTNWEASMVTVNGAGSAPEWGLHFSRICQIIGVCGRWMILKANAGGLTVGVFVVNIETHETHRYESWNNKEDLM